MKLLQRAILALLLLSGSSFAAEPGAPGSTGPLTWRCWYDQKVHVTCVIQSLPEASSFVPQVALPPTVHELRTRPENFRNQFVHIPMYSPPVDASLLGVLARAVVCGSRPQCVTNFTAQLPPPAEFNAILQRTYEVDPAFTAPVPSTTLVAYLQ